MKARPVEPTCEPGDICEHGDVDCDLCHRGQPFTDPCPLCESSGRIQREPKPQGEANIIRRWHADSIDMDMLRTLIERCDDIAVGAWLAKRIEETRR